jgi:hypothetical protein
MPGKTQPVNLTLKGRRVVVDPKPIPDRKIGDKLRFDSKDGKFEVEFDKWIFPGRGPKKGTSIRDNKARTLRRRGPYSAKCYITTPAGIRYGYRGAGAHGNVG